MARRRKSEEDNLIPEDYREMIGTQADNPAYIAAWEHAAEHNNTDKACYVYAENHWQDYDKSKEPTDVEMRAEIARLQNQLEEKEREGAETS